jgi:outer membrane protein OmpA-like peptidoglycan-associated protein
MWRTMSTAAGQDPHRRARLVATVGAIALVVLFLAGAAVMLPRIARDLSEEVLDETAAYGVTEVEFNGQDGELRCAVPLAEDDAAAALAAAEDVEGVHEVTLHESCVSGSSTVDTGATSTVPPATAATTSTTTTVVEATTTTSTLPLPAEAVVVVDLVDGQLLLHGSVSDEGQHQQLLNAAIEVLEPENVVDEIVVDAEVVIPADAINRFTYLVQVMPRLLVSASAGWQEEALVIEGLYATNQLRDEFQQAADAIGVTATLAQRPDAVAADAERTAADMNALVTEQPILFDKDSAEIDPASLATLERLAGIAERFGALTIEVQGHTDSEGDAERNRQLSQERADAVRQALVDLGVPGRDLTAVGYGEAQPILDENGDEVPELSRRVVFGVALAG